MKNIIELLFKIRGSAQVIAEFQKLNNVIDKQNKKVSQLENQVRKLSRTKSSGAKAASSLTAAFKNFNRTIFATTAIMGMVSNAVRSSFRLMNDGAMFDRLKIQFKNTFGENSNISKSLSKFTDSFIPVEEAMRSALSMKKLGMVDNVDQASKLIAQAGVAGKLAGLTAAEGVKRFEKFWKDGAVSHLEHLNVTRRTNAAFATQLTILKARGGIIGGVISQQHKLAFAQQLLNNLTKESMFGSKDNADTVQKLGESWKHLQYALGNLITTALKPLLEKYLIPMIDATTNFIDESVTTNGIVVTMTRNFLLFAGAIGAVISAMTILGTLSAFKLLGMAMAGRGGGIAKIGKSISTAGTVGLAGAAATSTTQGNIGEAVVGAGQLAAWILVPKALKFIFKRGGMVDNVAIKFLYILDKIKGLGPLILGSIKSFGPRIFSMLGTFFTQTVIGGLMALVGKLLLVVGAFFAGQEIGKVLGVPKIGEYIDNKLDMSGSLADGMLNPLINAFNYDGGLHNAPKLSVTPTSKSGFKPASSKQFLERENSSQNSLIGNIINSMSSNFEIMNSNLVQVTENTKITAESSTVTSKKIEPLTDGEKAMFRSRVGR